MLGVGMSARLSAITEPLQTHDRDGQRFNGNPFALALACCGRCSEYDPAELL